MLILSIIEYIRNNGALVRICQTALLLTFFTLCLPVNGAINLAVASQKNATKALPENTKNINGVVIAKQDVQGKSISTVPVLTSGEVQVGEYLREVELDGLNGEGKNFSNFKGKPLIINIWASWCSPCRAEMGSLKRLAQRYDEKQFNLIGISVDNYRKRAEAFIRRENIQFKNFFDHNLELKTMLGTYGLPLTIFVDKDGKVLLKVRGSRQWDRPEMIDAIGELLHIKLEH